MEKKSTLKSIAIVLLAMVCIYINLNGLEAEGRTIKVAWIADMTGPTAQSVIPMLWGTQDWFKYVNEDLGGIKGVKVDVIWGDAAYKLDLGLQLYSKFSSDKDVCLIYCSTTHINNAIAKKCMEDRILQYAASPAPEAMYPVKWCYSHSAGYGDQLGAFIDWALSKWTEKRPMRLGLIFMDNPFGKTIYDAGGVNYCKAREVEIVAEEPLPALATDVTVNLGKMAKEKPDFVYYQGTVDQAAIIARDARKIDFTPKICLSANSVADQVVSVAGQNSAEGLMIMAWSNPWHGVVPEEMKPGLVKTANFFKKYRPSEDPSKVGVGYFHGLMGSMITTQALKLALEKVPAKDINGATLKEQGFDRIKNFRDTWDLIGPISYTPEDHRGGQYLKTVGIKKGLAYSITDWLRAPYLTKDQCLWSPHVKSGSWSEILK